MSAPAALAPDTTPAPRVRRPRAERLRAAWRARPWWVGPVALGLLYLFLTLRFIHVNVDDSYMLYRYASNIAGGRGITYTNGMKVEGSTTFLYIFVLAFFFKILHFDVVEPSKIMWMALTSKAIGAALGLGTLTIIGHTVERVMGLPRRLVLASLLSIVLLENFVYSTTNGLETSLVCFLYVAMAASVQLWSSGGSRKYLALGILSTCLLVLCRADALLMAGAFIGTWTLLELYFRRPKLLPLAGKALLLGVPPLLTDGAHFLFRHWYFGRWFPQSYYVKIWSSTGLGHCVAHITAAQVPCSTFAWERIRLVVEDYVWTGAWGYVILAALFAAYMLLRRKDPASDAHTYLEGESPTQMSRLHAILVFVVPSAPLLFYVFYTGDWMPGRRVMMHFLPLTIVLLTAAGLRLVWTSAVPGRTKATGAAFIATLVLGTAWTSELKADHWVYSAVYEVAKPEPTREDDYLSQSFSIFRRSHDVGYYLTMYREFWAEIARYLQPGDAVAMFESGYASLALGEKIDVLDTSGLNNQRLSYPQDGEMYVLRMGRVYYTCGEEGPDPKRDYLLKYKPKFIIFDTFEMYWCKKFPTTIYGGKYRYVDVPFNGLGFFSVYARADLNLPDHSTFPSYRCSPACMAWLNDE